MKFIRGRNNTVFFSEGSSEYKIKRHHRKDINEPSTCFRVPKFKWEVSLMDKNDKYNSLKVFNSIDDAKDWAERHKNGTEG